jgi:hypothetical protein
MLGRVLVAIIAIFLLLGAFAGPISDGIKTWRSDSLTQNEAGVTTGAGVTSANVTLDYDLFQADATNVQSITSTIEETPVATSYDEDTNALLVSDLTAEQTRTLAITYLSETEDTVMRVLGPFLAFLIFGGILGALAWGVVKGGGRR